MSMHGGTIRQQYKRPDDLELWAANIRRIYVNKGGYDEFGGYWGVGLPIFSFDLRSINGRTISTETVRAKSIRNVHLLAAIRKQWPTVKGVKRL